MNMWDRSDGLRELLGVQRLMDEISDVHICLFNFHKNSLLWFRLANI